MQDDLRIQITTNAGVINTCALMMRASEPWVTLGVDYSQALAAFEGPCKEVYVAYYKGETAGFVILQVCGSFKGYIQTLCVSPHTRGHGIGTQLLQFCEKRILKISPNVFICVSSFNTGAIKLYQRFGFTLVGELPSFVRDGFTELLMRKTAGPLWGYKPTVGEDDDV